jgi:hypothetical protein
MEGDGGILFRLTLKLCSITSLWSFFAPLGGVPLEQLNLVSRNPQVFVVGWCRLKPVFASPD